MVYDYSVRAAMSQVRTEEAKRQLQREQNECGFTDMSTSRCVGIPPVGNWMIDFDHNDRFHGPPGAHNIAVRSHVEEMTFCQPIRNADFSHFSHAMIRRDKQL